MKKIAAKLAMGGYRTGQKYKMGMQREGNKNFIMI